MDEITVTVPVVIDLDPAAKGYQFSAAGVLGLAGPDFSEGPIRRLQAADALLPLDGARRPGFAARLYSLPASRWIDARGVLQSCVPNLRSSIRLVQVDLVLLGALGAWPANGPRRRPIVLELGPAPLALVRERLGPRQPRLRDSPASPCRWDSSASLPPNGAWLPRSASASSSLAARGEACAGAVSDLPLPRVHATR